MGCQFSDNVGELIKIKGNLCKPNLYIIGHSYFVGTLAGLNVNENYILIHVSSMIVYIGGPLIALMNHANTILHLESCNVTFSQNIAFKSNECDQVINLQYAYIKIMEYSNVTFIANEYRNKIIEKENHNEYILYPMCLFQLVTLRNTTSVSLSHYSINFVNQDSR